MMPGGQELIIILVIVVLLFGAKKIPELAKGVGKGIKSFKKEMKDEEIASTDENDEKIEKKDETKEA